MTTLIQIIILCVLCILNDIISQVTINRLKKENKKLRNIIEYMFDIDAMRNNKNDN